MTQEDIIYLAREAGFAGTASEFFMKALVRFAKLVAAKEREACAAMCEAYQDPFSGNDMAYAIRARGEE